jgi:hypothetical protein
MGLLLGNHLLGVFLFDDDHLKGSSRWHMCWGWRNSRWCGGVSSVVVILILIISILIATVVFILVGVAGQNPLGSSVSTTRGAGKPTLPPMEPRDL